MNDNEIIARYKKYEPFFGSWYIKRFIGEGGFAKVFEIVRNDFGNEYTSALKIITVSKTRTEIDAMKLEGMSEQDIQQSLREIVEDTVREIQLMYKLRGNGNIVGYEDHAVMEHEDGLGWDIFIKMEFLTSLSGYIKNGQGKIAKRDIIKLGIDICKALETCQKFNIIHRDIKSDNIFISNLGDFKLGDFGIARVIERKDTELSKKGTSAYMAPEVYKGQTYTSAVDIYSLGIVLYRLLNNNRAPFLPPYPQPISLDDRDRALMRRMSGDKFPKPAQAGGGRLTEIVLKACAYRPEERYSSPVFMRQELESILLNEDEITTEEQIMIYEEEKSNSSVSYAGGMSAPKRQEPAAVAKEQRRSAPQFASPEDGATEVLRNEETEVLRGEATEVLRNEETEVLRGEATGVLRSEEAEVLRQYAALEESTPVQSAPAPAAQQNVKVMCISCGELIDRDMVYCPFCGSNQKETAQKTAQSLQARWKKKTIIWGICAAILVIAVIIGITAVFNKRPDDKEIRTITFVDTLDDKPSGAWSAPEFGSGKVYAWAVARDDGYDLYIGAEGGVVANKDCKVLFRDYSNVEQIHFNGNFDTSNVTNMYGMFADLHKLTFVDIGSFDTSNVTNMGSMFSGCNNLTSVDLSGFDTSNVTDMSNMFSGCKSLTSVDVSSFDTSNVTTIYYIFFGCSSLSSVDLSNFTSSQIDAMRLPSGLTVISGGSSSSSSSGQQPAQTQNPDPSGPPPGGGSGEQPDRPPQPN